MFGRKGKEVIVEEIVPPTYSSAAIEFLQEFVAPVKDYIPSAEDPSAAVFVVLASVFLLSAAFFLFRAPPTSASAAVIEEAKGVDAEEEASAEEAVVTEEVPKEVGDEHTQVESVELTAASSASSASSNAENDEIVSEDDSEFRAFQEHVSKMADVSDSKPSLDGEEVKANDILAKPPASQDEVSALGTASEDSSEKKPSPPPASQKGKAVSIKATASPSAVATNPDGAKARTAGNLQKAKSSAKVSTSTSNNSLSSLKRKSMKKLKSVKQAFK